MAERPMREADRVYIVLTRDLGLIQATALGVRKEMSKLRGALEPFTLSLISVVRGKEYWRATSAQSLQNIYSSPALARSLALLEKLVQGEVPHPELFDAVESALKNTMIYHSEENKEMFEISLVSKILFHLGYLKKSDLNLDKKNLIKAINNGIQVSHL